MTVFRIIDFESTGIPDETKKHAIVEAGWCDVHRADDKMPDCLVLDPQSMLCNPGRMIPPEAMAVHHIRDVDVAEAASPDQVCVKLMSGGNYYVAHKADFERQFFGGGDVPWIDTWKVALRIWPDAPSHGLQVLRYWLKFDDYPLFDRDLAQPAHRAGPDTYVTAFLFVELVRHVSIEQMVKWSSGPALLAKVGFGKHYGKTWKSLGETDRGYLHWIIDKSDITDRDIRATAKYYLGSSHPDTGSPAGSPVTS